MIPQNTYHFSVDDVFDCLIEVSDQKIGLFDHPFFSFLKHMHGQFGISVSLYVFYQKNINGRMRTLDEVTDLKTQLVAEPWVNFGPHALDYDHPPYSQTPREQMETFEKIYGQIERFAGKNKFSAFVRLQYYSESFELAGYFKARGVKALFTTDKQAGSYRMPKQVSEQLLNQGFSQHENMDFVRTHFRVEFFVDENLTDKQVLSKFKAALEKYGFIIFYTHEIEMYKDQGKSMAKLMFATAEQLGLKSILIP